MNPSTVVRLILLGAIDSELAQMVPHEVSTGK
jgi:hypothetical protein